MTCIVALEHDGKVYMGGDSAAVSDWDIQPIVNPKVFQVGEFLIGYTSSFRMGQLLEYNLIVPQNDEDNELKYLVTKFIPAVRQCLSSGGYTKIENNQEEGGEFLVGYHEKAYKVGSDFQISRKSTGFIATGCGATYALGALAAMTISDPEKAIIKALEISGTFCIGVRGPYYVLSLGTEK